MLILYSAGRLKQQGQQTISFVTEENRNGQRPFGFATSSRELQGLLIKSQEDLKRLITLLIIIKSKAQSNSLTTLMNYYWEMCQLTLLSKKGDGIKTIAFFLIIKYSYDYIGAAT